MENNESQNTEMKDTESQNSKMNTTIVDRIAVYIILILIIALFITVFNIGKLVERDRADKYNAKLEELCKWIDGYEIVNAKYDYECNPSLKYTWTLTRINNGNKETITVEAGTARGYSNTCPIYKITRVSPDNKYHIVEDDGKLVVYCPNDYYNTVSKSKYSSK